MKNVHLLDPFDQPSRRLNEGRGDFSRPFEWEAEASPTHGII